MRRRLRHACGVCLAGSVFLSAWWGADAQPLPETRPNAAMPADEAAAPDRPAPLPRPRPAEPEAEAGLPQTELAEEAETAQEAAPEPVADPPPPPADAGAEVACRSRLKALGVAFEEMEPIDGEGACGAAAPIRVGGLGSGIKLSPPATLNCPTAEALARWAQEVVVPAAERHLGARPESFVNAASYVCRTRNNRPGAKLSEHATANAIDISGIAFAEDDPVPILLRSDEAARERTFQRAIRRGACKHFTTVIGPGTNAAHATHFHFDLAARRGGYRLCE